MADSIRHLILAVGSEWYSRHGGLSSLNRDLCCSFAASGHEVVCIVPRCAPDELEDAKASGVRLSAALNVPGLSDDALLCLPGTVPSDFRPTILIGHGHVTGPAAAAIAQTQFPGVSRVHFVHTAPSEIEWFKKPKEGEPTIAEKAERKESLERELARTASLVVAIGPHLYNEWSTLLHGLDSGPPVHLMLPGLVDVQPSKGPPLANHILLVGRAEDDELKGLDIAAKALGILHASGRFTTREALTLVVRGAQTGTADKLREKLRQQSGTPPINVRVKEYKPDEELIRQEIKSSSLVLMPSRAEGFGLVGLEAIACGVPVLVSSRSGLGEHLLEREDASSCVVETTTVLEVDAPVWAAAIERVLRDKPDSFRRSADLRKRFLETRYAETAVSNLIDEINLQQAAEPRPSSDAAPIEKMARLSPSAAMLQMFARLDAAMSIAVGALGERDHAILSAKQKAEILRNNHFISDEDFQLTESLVNLRNKIAHSAEAAESLQSDQAIGFVGEIQKLIRALENASGPKTGLPRPEILSIRVFGIQAQPRLEIEILGTKSDLKFYIAETQAEPVKLIGHAVELITPSDFEGAVRVKNVVTGAESSQFVSTRGLASKFEPTYEVISAELPLYADADCTHRREGVVGAILLANEGGHPFQRIIPTTPGAYKAGVYVTHGPYVGPVVGETWFRDPWNGELRYAWTESMSARPDILATVAMEKLGAISLTPRKIVCEPGEARAVRVLATYQVGKITKTTDLTGKTTVTSSDPATAAIDNSGAVLGVKAGRTEVECEFAGFKTKAEVQIHYPSRGDRFIYFQGIRCIQEIRFDSQDNLYLCNQSESIRRINVSGALEEVVRTSFPDTYTSGIDCIAIDRAGTIYANHMQKQAVLRFTKTNTGYGPPETLGQNVPGTKKGIVISPDGKDVFIAVMGAGGRGQILHINSESKECVFSTMDMPIHLALDPAGRICTPSMRSQAVHVYEPTGKLVAEYFHGLGDAVSDIAINSAGDVYLPFFRTGKLAVIGLSKAIATVEVVAEGLGTPGGIAIDSRGRVYVADYGSDKIDILYLS